MVTFLKLFRIILLKKKFEKENGKIYSTGSNKISQKFIFNPEYSLENFSLLVFSTGAKKNQQLTIEANPRRSHCG